jgi:plastocyanin
VRGIPVIILLAACGGGGSDGPGGGTPDAGAGTVTIRWTQDAENQLVSTTVAAGTPVRWQNTDTVAHTVEADMAPPPATTNVAPGSTTATQTITTPGRYLYHCGIHPLMHGELIVQ